MLTIYRLSIQNTGRKDYGKYNTVAKCQCAIFGYFAKVAKDRNSLLITADERRCLVCAEDAEDRLTDLFADIQELLKGSPRPEDLVADVNDLLVAHDFMCCHVRVPEFNDLEGQTLKLLVLVGGTNPLAEPPLDAPGWRAFHVLAWTVREITEKQVFFEEG